MKKGMFGGLTLLLFWGASASLTAQQAPDYAGDLKKTMISVSKQMIAIIDNVKSVKDVERAEPKVKKAMNELTVTFTTLAENVDRMTVSDIEGIENFTDDPEVNEWNNKVEASLNALKANHPEAAAKLEELGNKYSEEFADVMQTLMMKLMEKGSMYQDPDEGEWEEGSEEY